MSKMIQPGAGIVFMKVGTHAREPLEDIIRRKQKEIADAGLAMWGYGGGTCHPLTMVQPFARAFERKSGAIYLCMEEMESRHFAEQKRADQSSADGINWTDIPTAINVLGSRYALIVKELRKESFHLQLSSTKVAVGNQSGKVGSLYIRGRIDKACLEIISTSSSGAKANAGIDHESTRISLVARLESPYAVFLRNRP